MRRKRTVVAAVPLVTLGLGAEAAMIMDSDSFFGVPTDLTQAANQLSVDLFDDLGGARTLTKVTVAFTGTVTSEGSGTNDTGSTGSVTIGTVLKQYDAVPQAGAPAQLPTLNPFPIANPMIGEVIVAATNPALAAGDTLSFGPGTLGSTPAAGMFMTTTDLDQFIGVGTFAYGIDTFIQTLQISSGGNLDISQVSTADATLKVIYEFEDVVLTTVPPALPLLISAVAALGFVGFRRARSEAA